MDDYFFNEIKSHPPRLAPCRQTLWRGPLDFVRTVIVLSSLEGISLSRQEDSPRGWSADGTRLEVRTSERIYMQFTQAGTDYVIIRAMQIIFAMKGVFAP